MSLLVGFSGAVRDGVHSTGTVVSIVLAVAVGFFAGIPWGVGVFFAGYFVSLMLGNRAGDRFLHNALAGLEEEEARRGGSAPDL